jgi:hypothetical protein
MDRTNFNRPGGYPWTLQDGEFNNDGLENIIKGVAQAQMDYTDTYTWIGSGLFNTSTNTLNISQGFIYDLTNDEIFYVPDSGNIVDSFGGVRTGIYAYVVETNDGTAKNFNDGNIWFPRKYRRIVFRDSTYSGTGISSWRGLTLENLIDQKRGRISFKTQDGSGEQKFKTMTRSVVALTAVNYAFLGNDPNEEVSDLYLTSAAVGALTITFPSNQYTGDKITIYNKSGYTMVGSATLATDKAAVYSVTPAGTWYEVASWTIA